MLANQLHHRITSPQIKQKVYRKVQYFRGVNSPATTTSYATTVTVCSHYKDFVITLEAAIIPKTVPPIRVPMSVKWPSSFTVNLAESLGQCQGADLLIGTEYYDQIVGASKVQMTGLPCLRETQFRWVVFGRHNPLNTPGDVAIFCLTIEDSLRCFGGNRGGNRNTKLLIK